MYLHLVDLCDVDRAAETSKPYGGGKRDYSAHLTNQYCRLMWKSENVKNTLTGELIQQTIFTLHTVQGVDIQATDRIKNIRLQDGTTHSYEFEVTEKLPLRGRMTRLESYRLKRVK